MSLSYTLQDVLGTLLGALLMPIIVVVPGYTLAWCLDLLDFRKRQAIPRLGIGLLVSISVTPVVIYLVYLWFSVMVIWGLLLACLILFAAISLKEWRSRARMLNASPQWTRTGRAPRWVFVAGGIWVVIALFSLIDLQWGEHLYFNVVSLDYSTRVSITDAVTRTGVPPANPGYYPGHPVPLTFIYHFWYILASLVDQMGGQWVDARMAMIASVVWCGLAVMAAIAMYLRERSPGGGEQAWRQALAGIGLLLVSGLDIIPFAVFTLLVLQQQGIIVTRGAMEFWNEQVAAWPGTLLWVPNHVAGAVAGLTAMLLFQHARNLPNRGRKIANMIVIGLGFASCVGLSTWVALVFAVFWGVWMIEIYWVEQQPGQAGLMLLAGLITILASLPFLLGVVTPGTTSGGSSVGLGAGWPVDFHVREFTPAKALLEKHSLLLINLANLALLPVNYMLELGFFFFVVLVWFQYQRYLPNRRSNYVVAEKLLLLVVFLITSFIRTIILGANDLGFRGWLPGQFVLIIWAVDVIQTIYWCQGSTEPGPALQREWNKLRIYLTVMLSIGVLTTLADLTLLRAFPIIGDYSNTFRYEAAPDGRLGGRTFAARQAYSYLAEKTPQDIIYQYNAREHLERASGIYGARQAAISDHTQYGITEQELEERIGRVSRIFEPQGSTSWETIDQVCKENWINIIVVNDTDPLWSDLDRLQMQRQPLYQNEYYKLFACGG